MFKGYFILRNYLNVELYSQHSCSADIVINFVGEYGESSLSLVI